MHHRIVRLLPVALSASLLAGSATVWMAAALAEPPRADAHAAEPSPEVVRPSVGIAEARGRAKMLHETIHGALQVMHRDFFDDENAAVIPSASLEDVFHELDRSHGIRVRWLTVNTDILNVDHQPQDAFEKAAVQALRSGEPHHEAVSTSEYRYAGAIRLASQCLKCHVKRRNSNEDRVAGLVIKMPISATDETGAASLGPEAKGHAPDGREALSENK